MSRFLQGRINSHKSDSKYHPERCGLLSHEYNDNHTMNYGAAKILESEKNLCTALDILGMSSKYS